MLRSDPLYYDPAQRVAAGSAGIILSGDRRVDRKEKGKYDGSFSGLRIRLRPTIFHSSYGRDSFPRNELVKNSFKRQDLLDSAFGTVFSGERLETKLRGKRSQSCKSDKFVTFRRNELDLSTESHDPANGRLKLRRKPTGV